MKNVLRYVVLSLYTTLATHCLFAIGNNYFPLEPKPSARTSPPWKEAKSVAMTVTGKVTAGDSDDQNEGLPGVNITVEGTSTGTVTDADGHYTLEIPDAGSVLVFSFIGYLTEEVKVGNQSEINVVLMPDIQSLSEVVVVGAAVKKSDLTGAISTIDQEKIREVPTVSVNQALQGRLPGVLIQNTPGPGGEASIRVRGNNSIQYGTNPIFVVDGLVIEGGFNMINPNDIASIDVLKDASATALYGSRGANGVVIITTKKGEKGEGKIAYDGWVGFEQFSKTMPTLGAQGIVDLRVDAFANTFMDENPGANRQAYINNSLLGENSLAFSPQELETYRSGKSYNWLNEVTRPGSQQNHTISFSKATDAGSYYLSFNYIDQKGLMKNSGYKRYTGKINIEQNIKSWLKVGSSSSYINSDESYVQGGVFSIATNANPLYPVNDTANYLGWGGIQSPDLYNPIRSLRIDGDSYQNRLMTSNYLNIKPINGLNIRSTFSVDLQDQKNFWYTPRDIGQSIRNSTDGTASQRKDQWTNWQWDNSVTYDKVIGNHNISGLLGFGLSKNKWNYNQVDATGFATDDFSYKYLNGAYLRDQWQLYSDFTESTLMSYIGRVNYSYDNRYFATLTGRYDGSSRFGPDHKWGLFPSLALAWNIAEESFFQSSSIDALKLRAGYGIAGNQNIPDFAYRSLYRPTYTNNSVTYVSDGRLGNSNLVWEKQKQLNLGVDLSVLHNRLNFTADYYIINNEDLLMQRTLSSTTGFNNTIANVGALRNKGMEYALSAVVVNQGGFVWNVSANLSADRNKITKLYGDVDAIYNKGGYTGVEIQREGNLFLGKSLNSIYVYKFDKIAQEDDIDKIKDIDFGGRTIHPGDIIPVDKDHNNIINDDDRYVVGNKDPKFYGGFTTDLSYRHLTLNAVFNYNYGAKRISYLYESLMGGSGLGPAHEDELDRWTPEHTNTQVPRAYNGGGRYSISDVDWSVQDASFLRLSALTLAYNFPDDLISSAKLSNLRLYVTGSNLFLATKYKGFDPEGGDDYPTSRMLVTGVNISF